MVNVIDNTDKVKISDAEIEDALAQAKEGVNYRVEHTKEQIITPEQKETRDADIRNAESVFKGLTKDNLIVFGNKMLAKVAIRTRQGSIIIPNKVREKKGALTAEYAEYIKISPTAKEKFEKDYPGIEPGWRIKFNVQLIEQINLGACIVERDLDYEYRYYTVPIDQIDFAFPGPQNG